MRVRVVQEEDVERYEEERRRKQEQQLLLNKGPAGDDSRPDQTVKREGDKIGRNSPCPCGSGKKYKKCHGQLV
jgi:preprotein translocase subunit SecA